MAINPSDVWTNIYQNGFSNRSWPGVYLFYAYLNGLPVKTLYPPSKTVSGYGCDNPAAANLSMPNQLVNDGDDTTVLTAAQLATFNAAVANWSSSSAVPGVQPITCQATVSGIPILTDPNQIQVVCFGLKSGGALASSGGINLLKSAYWYVAVQLTQKASVTFTFQWYPNVLCEIVSGFGTGWFFGNNPANGLNLSHVDSPVATQNYTPTVNVVITPVNNTPPTLVITQPGSNVSSSGCPSNVLPQTLHMVLSGGSGMDGTYTLGYDASTSKWIGTGVLPALNGLNCSNRNLQFFWNTGTTQWMANVGGQPIQAISAVCSPFSASFSSTAMDCTGGATPANISVTV